MQTKFLTMNFFCIAKNAANRKGRKELVILLLISCATLQSFSQDKPDNWAIRVNGIMVMHSNKEDEKANRVNLTRSSWRKNSYLEIVYTEAYPDKTWKRIFLLDDEDDNELLRKDRTARTRISMQLLHKLYSHKKELRLYTIVSPLDPNIAV